MSALVTLDVERVHELRTLQVDGEPDLVVEMVQLFVFEVRARLGDARRAAASGDAETVGAVAHNLKGCCGSIGAERMGALAEVLESTLGERTDVDLAAAVRDLDEEFDRVCERLRAFAPPDAAWLPGGSPEELSE